MVSSTYRTGTWLGIVRSGSVIVLESNTSPNIVNRLWDFLGQDPTIHGVLNEVTNQFGTGLTGLPSFAILVQSDKLHAILRGDITLIAHLNGSAEVVSGRDVSTWSERSLVLPESLELTMADPDADETALDLAVSEAVVRLQSLLLDTAGNRLAGDVAANDVPAAVELASSPEAKVCPLKPSTTPGRPPLFGLLKAKMRLNLRPRPAGFKTPMPIWMAPPCTSPLPARSR
ncbi:hypothetical protein NHF46_04655 [Arthrobacter alpinus]|nr:hypothetical protein [Arthrobacter alpinus]